jgi:hypothetical protein
MKPFDILSQGEFYRQMPKGEESGWIEFARLIISSGKVAVSDPAFYRDLPPPPTFEIDAGTYSVAARLVVYPEDTRVSRLRLLTHASAKLGARIGDVAVDFTQIGVFDPVVLNDASDRLSEDQARRMLDERMAVGLYGVAHFGEEEAIMPITSSGFGDGRYPIHELTVGGRRVGIEVVFIGPEVFVE